MTLSYKNYGQILNRNIIEIFEKELTYYDLKEFSLNLNDTSLLEVLIKRELCKNYDYYEKRVCYKTKVIITVKINGIVKLNTMNKINEKLTQLTAIETTVYNDKDTIIQYFK